MKTISLSLLLVVLAGCSTSSGVVSLGQDNYMIACTRKNYVGASAPVKAEAIKEADAYCKKQGKALLVTRTVQQDVKLFRSDPSAEVYFKCLDKNDPRLKEDLKIEEIWK